MELLTWMRADETAGFMARVDHEADRLAAAGIRIVMPEVHDPALVLATTARALHRRNMELHPWIRPTFGVPHPVCRVIADPTAQQSRFGTTLARACLSNQTTLDRSLTAIKRFVAANQGAIDGLHLDYVRNDNALFLMHFPCQCEACREERRPWLGRGELRPEDMANPCIAYKELRRRNDRITKFVRQARALTRARGLALSLAARANYISLDDIWQPPVYGLGPAVFEGQDWAKWAADGLLDFICTMNYHTAPARFRAAADEHARLLAGTPAVFYSGLGVKSSMGACAPGRLRALLDILRERGARGASLFSWGAVTAAHGRILKTFARPPRA